MKYIKKQIIINSFKNYLFNMNNTEKEQNNLLIVEAFRYQIDNVIPNWFINGMITNRIITHSNGSCNIKTTHGIIKANKGDYIILGYDHNDLIVYDQYLFEKEYCLINSDIKEGES